MKYILNSTDATVAKIEVTELYKEKFITHIGRGGNIKKYSKDFEAAGILFGMDKAVSEMAMNDIIAAIKSGTSLTRYTKQTGTSFQDKHRKNLSTYIF